MLLHSLDCKVLIWDQKTGQPQKTPSLPGMWLQETLVSSSLCIQWSWEYLLCLLYGNTKVSQDRRLAMILKKPRVLYQRKAGLLESLCSWVVSKHSSRSPFIISIWVGSGCNFTKPVHQGVCTPFLHNDQLNPQVHWPEHLVFACSPPPPLTPAFPAVSSGI